jgi:hypothetical protein
MTTFFLAGQESGTAPEEDAYRELRARSMAAVGCPAKARRIFKLSCRLDGEDCVIEVGLPLPGRGGVVAAILDHGREEAFVVHIVGGSEEQIRIGRPVYLVTEFSK